MNLISRKVNVAVPELALIAVTRVVLGIGAGLLLSSVVKKRARRAVGLTLFMAGVIATVPLAMHLRDKVK